MVAPTTDGGRQVLLIRRDDCGAWAIPGGMADPGEHATATLLRELCEETGVDLAAITPQVLTRTYINDPRNTDEAWVASTVALFRVPNLIHTSAGSDALDAAWWPFDSLDTLTRTLRAAGDDLYDAHHRLLHTAHRRLLQHATD